MTISCNLKATLSVLDIDSDGAGAAQSCRNAANSQNEIVQKNQKKTKPTFAERQRRKYGRRRDPGAGKVGGAEPWERVEGA